MAGIMTKTYPVQSSHSAVLLRNACSRAKCVTFLYSGNLLSYLSYMENNS